MLRHRLYVLGAGAAAWHASSAKSGRQPAAHAAVIPAAGQTAPDANGSETIKVLYEPPGGKDPTADILFFHGLQFGDYKKAWEDTWTTSGTNPVLWPKDWLGTDFPDARIMSVSYDSAVKGRLDFNAIGSMLAQSARLQGVGHDRPVILIGHSLGGLALKKMCVTAREMGLDGDKELKALADNVAGAFFYATPHAGSILASPGSALFSGPMVDRLRVLDESSVELNNEFRKHFGRPKFDLMCLYEVQALRVLPGWLSRLPVGVRVVEPGSAMSGVDKPVPCQGDDHISICKPKSKDSNTYAFLKGYIADCLKAYKSPPQSAADHEAYVQRVGELEKSYIAEVMPEMKTVKRYKEAVERAGGCWPDAVLLPGPGALDAAARQELMDAMERLWPFWKKVQQMAWPKGDAPPLLPPETFFTNSWAGRGREYRLLVEPLDIVNWYMKGKNIRSGHYADGIVNETKDDNEKRPGRYTKLQETEVRVFGSSESSLGAAHRLKEHFGDQQWQAAP